MYVVVHTLPKFQFSTNGGNMRYCQILFQWWYFSTIWPDLIDWIWDECSQKKFWCNACSERRFAISAKLLQASGDATGPASVGQVLAQRQQGVVPKCGLLPLHGGHRERRTFGAAHSGLFDRNTNSPSAIWLHSGWRVLGSIPILFLRSSDLFNVDLLTQMIKYENNMSLCCAALGAKKA